MGTQEVTNTKNCHGNGMPNAIMLRFPHSAVFQIPLASGAGLRLTTGIAPRRRCYKGLTVRHLGRNADIRHRANKARVIAISVSASDANQTLLMTQAAGLILALLLALLLINP